MRYIGRAAWELLLLIAVLTMIFCYLFPWLSSVHAWETCWNGAMVADLAECPPRYKPPTDVWENPSLSSPQSGIGVISGWACEAETVEVWVEDQWWLAAYGTRREDTERRCGDTDNGWALLYNWNRLGDGRHLVGMRIDGGIPKWTRVYVTTFGQEFMTSALPTRYCFPFPTPAEQTCVQWEESLQNFVIVGVE